MSPAATAAANPALFEPVTHCWVCGGAELTRVHQARFDFRQFAADDPELDAYTGEHVWIVRCGACGFGQPERMPTLPRFFDRMYAQRWSEDWVAGEFGATYKDFIFASILRTLGRRAGPRGRRLLDVGAHAGRFLHLAQQAGWAVEGIELNPRTASYAARQTGAVVHHRNAHELAAGGHQYSAVVLTDVLEHIPRPVDLLTTLAALTERGGTIAIKVPCGPSQMLKERTLAALTSHRVSLAENLVHVNHFSPGSLVRALERAGFSGVTVQTGAPELLPANRSPLRAAAANALRLAVYAAGRMPGAVHTPLALNLQAYGTRSR